jgi:hypothetical protein
MNSRDRRQSTRADKVQTCVLIEERALQQHVTFDAIDAFLEFRKRQYMTWLSQTFSEFVAEIACDSPLSAAHVSVYNSGRAHQTVTHMWPERAGSGREARIIAGASAGGGCPVCALLYRNADVYALMMTSGLTTTQIVAVVSDFIFPTELEYNIFTQPPNIIGMGDRIQEVIAWDVKKWQEYNKMQDSRKAGQYKRTWVNHTQKFD